MTELQPDDSKVTDQSAPSNALLWVGIAILAMTIGLVVIAAVLAANAATAGPGVRIVRDVLIIAMTMEVIVVGAAITILIIQVARLVNLVRNEVEPIIEATQDTVNTVRGTAAFLSKNLVEPVTSINSTIRGISKVAGDVDAIRKAAGAVSSFANAATPMSTTEAGDSHTVSENSNAVKHKKAQPRVRAKSARSKSKAQ